MLFSCRNWWSGSIRVKCLERCMHVAMMLMLLCFLVLLRSSRNMKNSYRNLTSSGLIGTIASGISNLKSIEYLDLSNNNLTGAVPDFLSQPRFLRVLNLEGNQLSGAIPIQLLVRSENSTLQFNFGGNQDLCSSGSCNKRNGNKVVVPLVTSIGGAFLILAVAAISFRIYNKRHHVSHKVIKLGANSRIKQELESKKQEFTYEEVLRITRNFEKVIGKGASGTVYHGWIDHNTLSKCYLPYLLKDFCNFKQRPNFLL
ncbi:probable LRR receptor-like serine/threonine-protein kinase At1g05700 isoform X2 [Medicago truncatula]|nr:probable LRR receptor-like serine/threonine-protein kinase At1g05700 isoform X2 [Medicago truncatula]